MSVSVQASDIPVRAEATNKDRLKSWLTAFLRCDGSLADRLRRSGVTAADMKRGADGDWRLRIDESLGGLWIEDMRFQVRQRGPRQEISWILNVKGAPADTYPMLSQWLPQDGVPMQTTLKRGKPRHVRVEASGDGRTWQSVAADDIRSAFDEGTLPNTGLRALYFGQTKRGTVRDNGTQTDSVTTSVQCHLVTDSAALAPKLRALAAWPEMLDDGQ